MSWVEGGSLFMDSSRVSSVWVVLPGVVWSMGGGGRGSEGEGHGEGGVLDWRGESTQEEEGSVGLVEGVGGEEEGSVTSGDWGEGEGREVDNTVVSLLI